MNCLYCSSSNASARQSSLSPLDWTFDEDSCNLKLEDVEQFLQKPGKPLIIDILFLI